MYAYVTVWVCAHGIGQKRALDPPRAELQAIVSCLVRVQRTELGFFVSADALVTSESSLQPQIFTSLFIFVLCDKPCSLRPSWRSMLGIHAEQTCSHLGQSVVSTLSSSVLAVGFLQNPFYHDKEVVFYL